MGEDASKKRLEIAQTRERLGDTIGAIAYKADIRSRLRENFLDKVETAKDAVRQATDGAKAAAQQAAENAKATAQQAADGAKDAVKQATDVARETLKQTQK